MTAWTWLHARLVTDDLLVRSEVGPPMSRGEAVARVQQALDATPGAGALAARWRAGDVADGALSAATSEGMALWAVLEVPDGVTARNAAAAWLEGWAETLRAQGLDVTVAKLPT